MPSSVRHVSTRVCRYSRHGGLQTAVFCASVAHVPGRTLRYGSRNPPFSARHDLNLNRPLGHIMHAMAKKIERDSFQVRTADERPSTGTTSTARIAEKIRAQPRKPVAGSRSPSSAMPNSEANTDSEARKIAAWGAVV